MTIETLQEIYAPGTGAGVPLGLRVDDFVLADRLDASDPVTGEVSGDLEEQVAKVYEKMEALVTGAGGVLDNIAKCSAFIRELPDREAVNGEYWERVFPERENRPAYKVILADLPPGQLVQLEVLGILGATRTRFDLPGVPARDPTIRIGPMIFSSRCHGVDGATGELVEGGLEAEAAQTYSNLRALTTAAGGAPTDIVELNAYGKTAAYAAPTRTAAASVFGDLTPPPALNAFVNHITARFEISVEMLAVVGARSGSPWLQQLYLDPLTESRRVGVRQGDLVTAPWLLPVTSVGSPTGAQLAEALSTMDATLAVARARSTDVVRLTAYLRDPAEAPLVEAAWIERFPEATERPPLRCERAPLPAGVDVALGLLAATSNGGGAGRGELLALLEAGER